MQLSTSVCCTEGGSTCTEGGSICPEGGSICLERGSICSRAESDARGERPAAASSNRCEETLSSSSLSSPPPLSRSATQRACCPLSTHCPSYLCLCSSGACRPSRMNEGSFSCTPAPLEPMTSVSSMSSTSVAWPSPGECCKRPARRHRPAGVLGPPADDAVVAAGAVEHVGGVPANPTRSLAASVAAPSAFADAMDAKARVCLPNASPRKPAVLTPPTPVRRRG